MVSEPRQCEAMPLGKQLARAKADAWHIGSEPTLDPGQLRPQSGQRRAVVMHGVTQLRLALGVHAQAVGRNLGKKLPSGIELALQPGPYFRLTREKFCPPVSSSLAPDKPSPIPEALPVKTLTSQDATLAWEDVRVKISAPLAAGSSPDCHTPTGDENEVGTCVGIVPGESPAVWKISTVTQRDRFVPVRWFIDARKDIRKSMSPDQLAARIKADGVLTSSISLDNPTNIDIPLLNDEIAIVGQAAYRPSQGVPTIPRTSVLAYVWQPTALLSFSTARRSGTPQSVMQIA